MRVARADLMRSTSVSTSVGLPAQSLEAVEIWHGEVEEYRVKGFLLDRRNGLSAVDEIASEGLAALVVELRVAGYEVSVSGLKDEVLDVLERTGCLDIIGADAVFPTRARAIEAIHHKAHEGVDERPCPLIEVVEIKESQLE